MPGELVIFCDIDRTQNIAPPSVKTTFSLLRGGLDVPPPDQVLQEARFKGRVLGGLNLAWHWIRPFTKDSRLGLEILRQAAYETDRKVRLAVLSGRDPGLHQMTLGRLRGSGRMKYFNKEVYLSTVNSSSGFKEFKGDEELQKGNSVVLIEDDLAAALRFGRLRERCEDGQNVLVLLLSNISNHPWLLRRAHIELPDNVYLMPSFKQGAHRLATMIREGTI